MLAGHVYLRAAETLIPAAVLGAEESAALAAAHASAREVPSGVYLEAANRSGSEILIERAVTRRLLHAQAVLRHLHAGGWA